MIADPGGDPSWVPMAGGFSNVVSRRGDLVRRRTGAQSPAVHQLLRWLGKRGFHRIPELVDVTPGQEILSYLAGEPVFRPWPDAVRTDRWMVELGTWLREYHQAVSGFTLRLDAWFLWGPYAPAVGMVVNRGDLGPWNVIQKDGCASGVIDWDMARFGESRSLRSLRQGPCAAGLSSRSTFHPRCVQTRKRLQVVAGPFGVRSASSS